jgi:hypothetical protein
VRMCESTLRAFRAARESCRTELSSRRRSGFFYFS